MQVPANCLVALNCHHRVNVRMTSTISPAAVISAGSSHSVTMPFIASPAGIVDTLNPASRITEAMIDVKEAARQYADEQVAGIRTRGRYGRGIRR